MAFVLIKGACIVWLSFGTSVVAQDRWSLNTSAHKTGFTVDGDAKNLTFSILQISI